MGTRDKDLIPPILRTILTRFSLHCVRVIENKKNKIRYLFCVHVITVKCMVFMFFYHAFPVYSHVFSVSKLIVPAF